MPDELPPEILNGDTAFSYVYPLAHAVGWTDDQIRDALKLYSEIGLDGSIAGTSFRRILYVLYESPDYTLKAWGEIWGKYGNLYDMIQSCDHDLIDILELFDKHNVKSRDILNLFSFPAGIDFIDLLYKYKMEHINQES
jgi:hypothetical protein